MRRLPVWIHRWFQEQDGQGLVEYGLTVSLIAVAVMLSLQLLYDQVAAILEAIYLAMTSMTS